MAAVTVAPLGASTPVAIVRPPANAMDIALPLFLCWLIGLVRTIG